MNKRIYSLDGMRIIMAFLVVCIHVHWPVQKMGSFFTDFTRIAVPYFIMLSGYFYKREKTMEYIKKFLLYYLYASIFYLFVLFFLYRNWNFLDVELTKFCSYKFWICNSAPFVPVGWYLLAMIYIYIIVYILYRHYNVLYIFAVVSFFLSLLFGNYSFLLFERINHVLWCCNFICVFYWFVLGMLLKKYSLPIIEISKCHIGSLRLLLLFVFFLVCSVLEHFVIKKNGYSCNGYVYISTLIACLSLFVYLMCNPNLFSKIQTGKLPLWIYLTHVAFHYCLVIIFFPSKFSNLGLEYPPLIDIDINKSLLINNITVFMISIIMWYCLTGISKIFKKI